MIKDAKGSKDGWYWGEFWSTQCVDNNNPPFAVPYAGFGLYCLRCHASAEKEHTFTYERNIKGLPGEPDSYFVDLSWTTIPPPHPASPPPPCAASADSDIGEPVAGHTTPPRDAAEQPADEGNGDRKLEVSDHERQPDGDCALTIAGWQE